MERVLTLVVFVVVVALFIGGGIVALATPAVSYRPVWEPVSASPGTGDARC